MPAPPRTPAEFLEILELVWWRLDRALDLEMIEWSAKLGALEALESGCTAIIDHHESPNAIEGSLTVIADACAEVGVRVSTCYGVTDRHGADGARRAASPRTTAICARAGAAWSGVHAAFTCSDDTLAAAADLARQHGVGVHIHVAEGPADAGAADRLRAPDGRRLADRARRAPARRPRAARHGRPQPTLQHEQRGRLRRADPLRQPRRARYRRHRCRHARRVPRRVRTRPRTRRHIDPGDRLVAGSRQNWALFPEAATDRVTWSYSPIDPWRLAYTTGVRAIDVEVDGRPMLARRSSHARRRRRDPRQGRRTGASTVRPSRRALTRDGTP